MRESATPSAPVAPERPRHARRVLDGVPRIGYDQTLHLKLRALQAALEGMGQSSSLAWMLGVTGVAFRMRFRLVDGSWGPLVLAAEVPGDEAMLRCLHVATGRRLRVFRSNPPALWRCLDEGVPVLASDVHGNAYLIVGYDEAGKTLLVHRPDGAMYSPRTGTDCEELIRGELVALGERVPLPSRQAIFMDALIHAVGLWQHRADDLFWGSAAWKAWRQALLALEPGRWPTAEHVLLAQDHWRCLACLTDARRGAAEFLALARRELPARFDADLAAVESLYRGSAQVLREAAYYRVDVFVGKPWHSDAAQRWPELWDAQMRRREATMLADLANRDEQAIALLARTLPKEA